MCDQYDDQFSYNVPTWEESQSTGISWDYGHGLRLASEARKSTYRLEKPIRLSFGNQSTVPVNGKRSNCREPRT